MCAAFKLPESDMPGIKQNCSCRHEEAAVLEQKMRMSEDTKLEPKPAKHTSIEDYYRACKALEAIILLAYGDEPAAAWPPDHGKLLLSPLGDTVMFSEREGAREREAKSACARCAGNSNLCSERAGA